MNIYIALNIRIANDRTHFPAMRLPERSMRLSWVKVSMMLSAGNAHARSPPAKAPSSSRYPSLHSTSPGHQKASEVFAWVRCGLTALLPLWHCHSPIMYASNAAQAYGLGTMLRLTGIVGCIIWAGDNAAPGRY